MQPEFERFLQEHPQWNATTRAIYRAWHQTYANFLDRRCLPWQAATRSTLQEFQQQLLWTPNRHGSLQSDNTIYQGLRLLRAFYRWAAQRQLIPENPMDGWILSRPRSHQRIALTWEETQQLFRGPDLGQPDGQRDLLLLHLVYQGLSLIQCRQLEIDSEVPGDDTLEAVRRRYLTRARPLLMGRQEHRRLLVTYRGRPFISSTGLSLLLKRYRPGLNVLTLWESRRAQEDEIGRRWEKFYDRAN